VKLTFDLIKALSNDKKNKAEPFKEIRNPRKPRPLISALFYREDRM